MKVDILASGSNGNCIVIRSSNTTILVDVGIPKTQIEKRLLEVGIRPDSIDAIFITHAHSDHVKGLPLANKYRIPVFASEGEWKIIKNIDEGLINIPRIIVEINHLRVLPFHTHHDSFEPLGYSIIDKDNYKKASVCLDTGHVDESMIDVMRDSNIYIIEANHSPRLVEICKRPPVTKARILSDIGHLSNQQTANALAKLVKGKGEKIYLTHLSDDNNSPSLAKKTVISFLTKKGFEEGKHYEIEVF
ncbi:MBL fold metallo-hydrolase [Peribacillus loiseleuriae]|uniref:MBL fold metallo-hydrolase n=1 Tax=Peribacillus loiseleuriae TaxID=1679170 RepID=UPI003D02B18A